MNQQEKDLIQGVFDRLARAGVGQKDAEADALIRDLAARQPDALYGLVQAVIMQEMGLGQAQQTITKLQSDLDAARRSGAQSGGASSGSGFLSGPSPWGNPAPQPQPAPQAAYASAPQPMAGGRPQQGYPQPGYGQPQPYVQPGYAPQPQPYGSGFGGGFGGGGFLRNAATMAAGVAGGALIAQGISSLFSGAHGMGGMSSPWGGQPGEVVENVTNNITENFYGDSASGQSQDASSQDASFDPNAASPDGYQDASYDAPFDDGGSYDDSQDV